MAGLADLAAGMRLAGGTVSQPVFNQIGQENEQIRALQQQAQQFAAQQQMQRERMNMDNELRRDTLSSATEDRKLKIAEMGQARIDRMTLGLAQLEQRAQELESRTQDRNLTREQQAAVAQMVDATRRQGQALQAQIARESQALRAEGIASRPPIPIADPSSPTGFRYARGSEAVGQPAPAPAGSPERKAAQPLSSAELQKWQDKDGNHPAAGTSLADLEKQDSPYKVMTTPQLAMNAKFKAAQSAIDKMNGLVDKIWDPSDNEEGPAARTRYLVKFKTDRLTQRDSSVAQYDAFSRGTIAALVRAAGEVGNLNEWEQQRALNMIPKEGDTAPVARAKMSNLEDWLHSASRGAIGAPAFSTEEEAEKAAKAGRIKAGDKIRVKGQKGVWK